MHLQSPDGQSDRVLRTLFFVLIVLLLAAPVTRAQPFSDAQVIDNLEFLFIYDVHVADLDKDGNRDVVVAHEANAVVWYENNGDGTFKDRKIITTNAQAPRDIYTVDLNGDDSLDVLSASTDDNKIAWYENQIGESGADEDGFSDQQVIYESGGFGARSVHAADVTGDGDPDVFSSHSGNVGEKVAWYENLGGGNFSSQQIIATEDEDDIFEVEDVHTTDVDGDDAPDVLTASFRGETVAWYENQGGGSFGEKQTIRSGQGRMLTVFDAHLNRDGQPDVLTDSKTFNGVFWSWHENQGGSFTSHEIPDQSNSEDLHPADVNGDGKTDVVLAGGGITWFANDGSGSFSEGSVTEGDHPEIHVAELSGDLKPDVISFSDGFENKILLFENQRILPTELIDLVAVPGLEVVDLNWFNQGNGQGEGNGQGDSLMPGSRLQGAPLESDDSLNEFRIYRDTAPIDSSGGPGEMEPIASVPYPDSTYTDTSVTVGTTYYYRITAVDTSGAESSFSEQVQATPTDQLFTEVGAGLTGTETGASVMGDVDGDSNLDLLITGFDGSGPTATLYLGDGQGGFSKANAGLKGVTVDSRSSSMGDVNEDGNLDLLITGKDANGFQTATLYLGDGQGGFNEANAGLVGVEQGSTAFGDVNEDGHLDLVITGYDGSTFRAVLYLGNGQGGFSEVNAGLTGVAGSSANFGDVNNDGHFDLLITGFDGNGPTATVYLGDGQGGFNEADAGLSGVELGSSSSMGDVNNDGNLDLLITGENANGDPTTTVYLGDGNGGFTEANAGLTGVEFGTSSSIGDVNGDGNQDLLITGRDANDDYTTTLYLGDGQGGFSEANAGLVDVAKSSSWMGDMDGDGHLDLVITGEDESDSPTATLYENQTGGSLLVASASQTVGSDDAVGFGSTGVGINFSGTSGSGEVTVQKFDNTPPGGTKGISESTVSSYRYVLSAAGDLTFDEDTEVRLDVSTLDGVSTASNVTVYRRLPRGSGLFDELPTSFDSGANELVATTGSFSEFVLASNTEPLPVELAGFDAQVEEDKVRLTWQTTSETGNARFEVQRRAGERENGREGEWETVGRVEGSGTTTEAQSYRFTDENLPYAADRLTYRLRQVDTDGSAQFSKTVTVERGVTEVELLGTYPNPARGQTTVRYALPEKQEVSLTLYDALGRRVRTVVQAEKEGRQEQQLDTSGLPSGVYFLRLETGGQTRTQKLTVVQ